MPTVTGRLEAAINIEPEGGTVDVQLSRLWLTGSTVRRHGVNRPYHLRRCSRRGRWSFHVRGSRQR